MALAVLVAAPTVLAAPHDLNGDRNSDILYRDTATGAVSAVLMNGTVPGAAATILTAGSGWSVTHLADFNGDGKVDLLVGNSDGRIAVLLMNGTAVLSSTLLATAGSGYTPIVTGDFNGDGKADIVLKHADGAFSVLLMNGASVVSANFVLASASPWAVTHAGDFNGDGKSDLIIRHNDGSAAILIMNGTGATSAGLLLNVGSPWTITQLADFSGDGKADIVIANTDGSSAVLVMNGTLVSSAAFLTGAGSPYTVTHTGDFNGDGKADVVIKHTDGSAVILLMNGTVAISAAYLLSAGSTSTVSQVADYNGDGKSDLLLRNADGSATVVLMNGSVVTAFGNAWSAGNRVALPEPAGTAPPIPSSVRAEAARFLTQATFGPSVAAIDEVVAKGYARWIDDQFAIPASSHMQLAAAANARRAQPYNEYLDVQTAIWTAAIAGSDQLRQRVANAYSQIFVVNLRNSSPPLFEYFDSAANYYDMLGRNADGNFRTLIEDVTRHPVMGLYLSHLANQKEDAATGRMPDQNFAREIMQLFAIGLYELNADGTNKIGANGKPIETYTQADIEGLAKVFTGWSYDTGPTINPDHFPPYTRSNNTLGREFRWKAMRLYPDQHSPTTKSFLGTAVPAGTSGEQALKTALDRLFNHPNVGPFIGKQLIQRMVTSNPSPAYVARVSAAFANNGRGVRGDMGAVVRAILLDPEARDTALATTSPKWGRLKEPVIRVTNIFRALEAAPSNGDWNFLWNNGGEEGIGQAPFSAPSVFNYYRPGFVPAETAIARAGMVAPELQITNEVSTLGWTRTVQDMMRYQQNFPASLPLNNEIAIAADATALVQRLNLLFTAGTMSSPTITLVRDAIAKMPSNTVDEKRRRVWAAVTLIASSTEFLVQK